MLSACYATQPAKLKMGLERCVGLGFGHSRQLAQNKFFDPSTPSMRKGRDKGKNGKNREKNGKKIEKTNDYSGHYVIASSRPPKCRRLECCTFVPKILIVANRRCLQIVLLYLQFGVVNIGY